MSFFKVVVTLLLVMEIGVSVEGGVAPNNRKPPDLINKPKITVDDESGDMEYMDEDALMTEQWTHPDDMIHANYNNHDDVENSEQDTKKWTQPETFHEINNNHDVALLDMDNIFQRKMLRRSKRSASQRKPGYFNGKCDANFGCYSKRCNLTTGSCLCSKVDYGCKTTKDCCGKLSVCMVGKCKPLKPPGWLNTPCEEGAHCISNRCNTYTGLCACGVHLWPCQTKDHCCGELTKCIKGLCTPYYRYEKCIGTYDCFSRDCQDDKTCGCSKSIGYQHYCRTKSDCCHGIECVNGKCPKQVTGKICAEPYNCRSDRCTSGRCDCLYAGDEYTCTGDGCCNKRCLGRSCDLSRFKEPCLVNEHCYSNNCTKGICADECLETVDQGCGMDKECCRGQGYKCQDKKCCKLIGQTCAKDGHCCSRRCILGTCDLLNVNEACGFGDECHTTYCIALKCVCVPFDLICSKDIQCCDGLYCVGGFCATCKKYEDKCTQHIDCCGRYCSSFKCKCKPVGQWCETASQCCQGLYCLEGKCSQCLNENERCPGRLGCCTGSRCYDGYCKKAKELNEKCDSTPECQFADPNNECYDNICLISHGKLCSGHTSCASGNCASGKCYCIQDSQHPCNLNAECCHGHICEPGKGCCGLPGGDCSKNLICCSKTCMNGFCEKNHHKEACNRNEDCDSDSCVQQICECSKQNYPCRNKDDCCDGLTCYKNLCKNKFETSEMCVEHENCIQNFCSCIRREPFCTENTKNCMCKGKHDRCSNKNECCLHKECHNNECCFLVGMECKYNGDCCEKSECKEEECVKCSDVGESCKTSEDCCGYDSPFYYTARIICIKGYCGQCVKNGDYCDTVDDCCGNFHRIPSGYALTRPSTVCSISKKSNNGEEKKCKRLSSDYSDSKG